jgi:hypothetical protein
MFSLKRRYPRYEIDKPIVAHRLYEERNVPIRGRWRQFGEGGAGAQMSEQLRFGEVIQMDLSPSLKVYAAVRYSQSFYHGFEFVLLKEREKAELARMSREFGEQFEPAPEPKPLTRRPH